MSIEEILAISRQLPGVTEYIKWEHGSVFSAGGKIFCVIGLDQSPTIASFKVRDDEFEKTCDWPGFKPAPDLAKYKWAWTEDVHRMKTADWEKSLKQSYEMEKDKLPLKLRKQLGLL